MKVSFTGMPAGGNAEEGTSSAGNVFKVVGVGKIAWYQFCSSRHSSEVLSALFYIFLGYVNQVKLIFYSFGA